MIKIPENAGQDQDRDTKGRFRPGRSGNKAGKAPGTRNKATRAALDMMHGQLEQLTQTAIEKALEGDMTALKLVLDRTMPPTKDAFLSEPVELPTLSAENLPVAVGAVVQAVAQGSLTPGQGEKLVGMLQGFAKAVELQEIEQRVVALEAGAGGRK